jgi:predicted SAM-dependent methyltransferase
MTAALRPVAERKLRELREQRPLRLHLGSGFEYKAGWINLDLAPLKVDVPWNLANGIPFEPGTVEAILHEHLLEHLTLAQGHGLMRECVRVLEPGGVLRIGVPDAGACLDSYAGLADQDWAESQPTPMVAVMSLFYEHGHACMYDAETLELLCLASGFASAKRSDAGGGTLGADDTPSRRDGTLYVEAVR